MKFILLIAVSVLFSCAQVDLRGLSNAFDQGGGGLIVVNVDGIAEPNTFRKFVILPGAKGQSADDLEFKLYSKYIVKALSGAGYEHVDKNAEIAIYLTFGVGDPVTNIESYSIPIWGNTGYLSSQTSFYGNTAYTSYQPMMGVTGTSTQIVSDTKYGRFCILEAIDLDKSIKNKRPIPVWKTTLNSAGPSNDLRRVFPALAVFAKHFAGKNTETSKVYEITEEDEQIKVLKAP